MSFMSCHTAIIERLFRGAQFIIVTVTALTAIIEHQDIVKQSISFTFRANYAYGLFMGWIRCIQASSVSVL